MLEENSSFCPVCFDWDIALRHSSVLRNVEDNTNEETVLKFLNILFYCLIWSFFWKKMAKSIRIKCLLQAEDYSLSPLNVSLKYRSYFCLNFIYFTGTGDIKYAYTVYSSMRCFSYLCMSQWNKIPTSHFWYHIYLQGYFCLLWSILISALCFVFPALAWAKQVHLQANEM